MKVLLIEDDETIASFVIQGFKQAGFVIDHAPNAIAAMDCLAGATYDALIVDIMLPGKDGLSLIDDLRRQKIEAPTIILSAKRSVDDRVRGLEGGSDDYLTKPFAFTELLARVQALIRRAGRTAVSSELAAGDLSMNLLTREVLRGGEKIELQPREFALLEYLIRNAGRVVSKTMILERVWDYNFDPQTNVVDVLVCRLRNKLDRNFEKKLIHTIRGVGYVLKNV
jgi:two-component system, OmpR family, response regulator